MNLDAKGRPDRPRAGPLTLEDQLSHARARLDDKEHIDDVGVRLIARLAGKVALVQTAAHAPDVINRLAEFVDEPGAMLSALDRIARADRPGRDGLRFAVVKELAELREYCEVHRARDETRNRRRRLPAGGPAAGGYAFSPSSPLSR